MKKKKISHGKKNHKKEEPEDSIHVMISHPKFLRKEILTVAIGLIELLKRYEEYLEMRKHKETLLKLLKTEVHELSLLMKEFKLKDLPLTNDQFNRIGVVKEERKEEGKKIREVRKTGKQIEGELHEQEESAKKITEARERKARMENEQRAAVDSLESDLAALKDKLARI